MFNWLRKSWAAGKHVLGKTKDILGKGLQIFNKGKELYSDVKGKIANIPVIGTAANALLAKGEEELSKKTGLRMDDINKAASLTEKIQKALPTG